MARERDLETIRLVEAALAAGDVASLRKLSAVRGLVNGAVRVRAWPALLGLEPGCATPEVVSTYTRFALQRHRDSSTVQCDVDRSLWHFTAGWTEDQRAAKRAALQRLINGVVGKNAASVCYYQGLHDVASVVLMVCGEAAAYPLLERLVLGPLRECTRPTLEPVTTLLALLMPLLAAADPSLHAFLVRSGVLPFFGLAWVLTWHCHDAADLPTAARLFDLFLASGPLLPLYVGAAALLADRAALLALPCEAPEVHRHLTALNPLALLSADELAARALALHREHPPARLQLAAGVKLGKALTHYAPPRQAPGRAKSPHRGGPSVRLAVGALAVAATVYAGPAVAATVARAAMVLL